MIRSSSLSSVILKSSIIGLLGACAAQPGELKIRPVGEASAKFSPDAAGLAEAHAMLLLGNSGLALEAFRKIQRANPSAEALEGIAQSYVKMGRDDLARVNYEAALAMRPQDRDLLAGVARVMDNLGAANEAAIARGQASAPLRASDVSNGPLATNLAPSVPVNAETILRTHGISDLAKTIRSRALDRPSSSVTVSLPPARIATARPAPGLSEKEVTPRLERLSPSVVALVTTGKSLWTPHITARTATSVTVRWEPIRSVSNEVNVRILNAANVNGAALAARQILVNRGWRRIEVGSHGAVQAKSVVYYPAERRRLGKSLAAQFGIPSRQSNTQVMTVVLGNDLARRFGG